MVLRGKLQGPGTGLGALPADRLGGWLLLGDSREGVGSSKLNFALSDFFTLCVNITRVPVSCCFFLLLDNWKCVPTFLLP